MLRIEEGEKMVLQGKAEIHEAHKKIVDHINRILGIAAAASQRSPRAKDATPRAMEQVRNPVVQ